MKKIFVKKSALLSALLASRNVFPQEFIGLFRKDGKGVLCELIIPPLSEYGDDSSAFSEWHLPLDSSYAASFHSHPGWSNLPSEQDLQFFSRNYSAHFIACRPYVASSTACYGKDGQRQNYSIIDE